MLERPLPPGWGRLTKQKHLDLVALHHAVLLQLILNLLIALLPLLLLGAHTTTHFGGLGYRRTDTSVGKDDAVCRLRGKRAVKSRHCKWKLLAGELYNKLNCLSI